MGSLKLLNLAKSKASNVNGVEYTYVDIHLDLTDSDILDKLSVFPDPDNDVDNRRDLKISPDEYAIKNSLINLFNTLPGQRILIPQYGCDLHGYLFESVSVTTAKLLGNTIKRAIEQWEPRVDIENINVLADPDNNQYQVTISVIVPALSQTQVNFTGIFSDEGFRETQRSQYI